MAKSSDKENLAWCYDLIQAPIVTEKYYAQPGKCAFFVNPKANKETVKKAVEDIFKVEVKKVNIANRKGKRKRFKGIMGRRSSRKMAFITLKEGSNINLEQEV